MKSNRLTNEELNKMWDYVGDDNISWYYGDKPKCYLNNDNYHRYEKEYKEYFIKLDEVIPQNVFGKKLYAFKDWDGSSGAFLPLKDKWVINKASQLTSNRIQAATIDIYKDMDYNK